MKLFGETRKPRPALEFKRQIFNIAKKSGSKTCDILKKLFDRLGEPHNLFNQCESSLENTNINELLEGWDKEIINPHPRSMCCNSPSMSQTSLFYYCFECCKEVTATICHQCFIAGNHEGHRFKEAVFESDFRACDCGNADYIKKEGFCTNHSSEPFDMYNIPVKTKDRFICTWKLFFYIYFWLIDEVKKHEFQTGECMSMFDIYGDFSHERSILINLLFKHLVKFASKSYECMVLCYELLFQENFNEYPPIKNGNLPLFDQLMLLNDHYIMNNFVNLAKVLYPYNKARDTFLKLYIDKIYRNQLNFTHAFRKITLLYTKDVGLINKFIRAKQIKPLQMNFYEKFTDMSKLASCLYKYYEDLVYIHYNKNEREEFFDHLLSQVNVGLLAVYRRYSNAKTINDLNLDKFFVKVFGLMLSTVKQDTKLLEKCMFELMWEAKACSQNSQEVSMSLAQERAFALCMMAYCKGDISRLNDPIFCKRIIEVLGVKHRNKRNERKYFTKLITSGLLSLVEINIHNVNSPINSFEEYFHGCEQPIKNITHYLDMIYHKILLILSRSYVSYNEIILEVSTQMMKSQHKNQHLKFAVLSEFLVQMVTLDIDEMVVNEFIGIRNERRVFDFWEKLRGSVHEMNTVQFRQLATYFVNNHSLFDEFLIANPHLVSGKLVADPNSEAFPTFIGNSFLSAYLPKNLQIKQESIKGNPILMNYYFDNLFDEKFINEIRRDHSNLLQKTNWRGKYLCEDEIRRSATTLMTIYTITKSEIISNFFKDKIKMDPWVECVSKIFVKEIESIFKRYEEKEEVEIGKTIISLEERDAIELKKRREKILAKKKQKEDELRKKQNNILSKYVVEKEKEESDEEVETCIYCREGSGEGLHFIAYCNFTNTVESRALGSSSAHLFFTTCGHKVHRSCFSKHVQLKKEHRCMLCKKETNCIVPELSKLDINPEMKQERLNEFFDSMFAVLLQGNEDREALINQIYNNEYQFSIPALLLMSVAKEMLLIDHHNELHFKHMVFPIYSEIFQMISQLPLEKLKSSFDVIRNLAEFKNENLSKDQARNMNNLRALLACIEEMFMKECPIMEECLYKTEEKTIDVVRTIVKLLCGKSKHINSYPISTLSLIDLKDLLIPLPEDITDMGIFMGACGVCKTVTCRIVICLACGWKACCRDTAALIAHEKQKHLEGAIMLNVAKGEMLWVGFKNIITQNSIYENQFGEPYTNFNSIQLEMKNKGKFFANKRKLQEIRRSFIENSIITTVKRSKK